MGGVGCLLARLSKMTFESLGEVDIFFFWKLLGSEVNGFLEP